MQNEMYPNFSSPDDFKQWIIKNNYENLSYETEVEFVLRKRMIRIHWVQEYLKNPSDYNKLRIESLQEMRYEKLGKYDEQLLDIYKEEIYQSLEPELKTLLENHISFGFLATACVNASIYSSETNQFYVIILNSSLISLLTKIIKLDLAIEEPHGIIYCSDSHCDIKEFNSEMFFEMREEIFKYYINHGIAQGPILQLNEKLSYSFYKNIRILEKFIICHEIGHYIKDHIYHDEFWKFITEEKSRNEHAADIIGFKLLLNSEKNYYKKLNIEFTPQLNKSILIILVELFDIFSFLENKNETDTHADPRNRLYCISTYYYGNEISKIISEYYTQGGSLDAIDNADIEATF